LESAPQYCDNTYGLINQKCYASCDSWCPEDHAKQIITNLFYTTIKVQNAWNIPACGETASLRVNNLFSVAIGSYIWNSFGYFEIVGYDQSKFQITVRNNCTAGNAAVGTTIPSCTEFIIAPAPAGGQGTNLPDLFPYVAIDFTAPANGACLDITVTTVNGLQVGKHVQIAGGTYLLNGVSSSTVINICNEGSGVTPGTSIIALNAAGDFQHPVILIDANDCTAPAVPQGSLIVCHNNIAQPLDGQIVGSVPVLVDATTNEVEFQQFDIPTLTCTVLAACLIISEGVTSYVVQVEDTSIFSVGNIVFIGNLDNQFTITNIIDENFMQVDISPTHVGDPVTLDPGVPVCLPNCCEQLDIDSVVDGQTSENVVSGVFLTPPDPALELSPALITITNTSTNSMFVLVNLDLNYQGEAILTDTEPLTIAWQLNLSEDGGAFVIKVSNFDIWFTNKDSDVTAGAFHSWTGLVVIPPQTTKTLQGRANLIYQGDPPTQLEGIVFTTKIATLGVAL
jgi:hypothetical protein